MLSSGRNHCTLNRVRRLGAGSAFVMLHSTPHSPSAGVGPAHGRRVACRGRYTRVAALAARPAHARRQAYFPSDANFTPLTALEAPSLRERGRVGSARLAPGRRKAGRLLSLCLVRARMCPTTGAPTIFCENTTMRAAATLGMPWQEPARDNLQQPCWLACLRAAERSGLETACQGTLTLYRVEHRHR